MSKKFRYDAALSFAGSERPLAAFLASLLEANGVRVYYDDFEKWSHLGRNLIEELSDIYEKQCRFCIILISRQYSKRPFPILERRSALDRMMLGPEHGYILPIRVDDAWIKGLPRATCFIDLRQRSLIEAGGILVGKILGRLPEDGLHLPADPELVDTYVRNDAEQRNLQTVYSIKKAFQELKRCLLSESDEATEWVSRETISHYGRLKRHALTSSKAELQQLLFLDRLITLRLRVEIPSQQLLEMDEREVFSWGIRRGLVSKERVALGEVRDVALLGENLAIATTVREAGKRGAAVSRFRFVLEDDHWRLDLLDSLRHANLYLAEIQDKSDPDAQDFMVLETLSRLCGRRVSESVWMPLHPI